MEAITSLAEVTLQDQQPEEEEEEEAPRRNPFTLIKKPIVPEVSYRWQYGFRRSAGSTYQKV